MAWPECLAELQTVAWHKYLTRAPGHSAWPECTLLGQSAGGGSARVLGQLARVPAVAWPECRLWPGQSACCGLARVPAQQPVWIQATPVRPGTYTRNMSSANYPPIPPASYIFPRYRASRQSLKLVFLKVAISLAMAALATTIQYTIPIPLE